jgi:hypothetical protein
MSEGFCGFIDHDETKIIWWNGRYVFDPPEPEVGRYLTKEQLDDYFAAIREARVAAVSVGGGGEEK